MYPKDLIRSALIVFHSVFVNGLPVFGFHTVLPFNLNGVVPEAFDKPIHLVFISLNNDNNCTSTSDLCMSIKSLTDLYGMISVAPDALL